MSESDVSTAPPPVSRRRRRALAPPAPEGPTARVIFRDGRKKDALHTGYQSHRFEGTRIHLILWPNTEVVYPLDVVESLTLPYTPQPVYQPQYAPPPNYPIHRGVGGNEAAPPAEYNARTALRSTVKDGIPYAETLDENGNKVVVAGGFMR